MRVGHHLLSIITFATYFTLAASALMAGDQPEAGYRLQLREPSAQYRLVEPRPRVLSRGRNATVTSLSRTHTNFPRMSVHAPQKGGICQHPGLCR